MKNKILLIACLIPIFGMAQTKTSIADGDWSDPQTWFPTGAPATQSDSIIINHNVYVHGNLEVQTTLWIQQDGLLLADETFALHGDITVNGDIYAERLAVGDGADFSNYGYIDAGTFTTTNDLNTNYNTIYSDSIYLVETFVNSTSGTIECLELITASSYIENNGTISTDSWIHTDNIAGTGIICIQGCFLNNGNINGSLDVCDMTPTGNGGITCDFNLGSIAPTVTICQNTFCGSPTSVIKDEQTTLNVRLYPNPINIGTAINIEVESTDVLYLTLIDALGRGVHEEQINNGITVLETSSFQSGVYFVKISDSHGDKFQSKIIIY